MNPRIGVVVVTYCSGRVLPGLLRSLAEHEPDARVVVVDNDSPGGPPEAGTAHLVSLEDNHGYGVACNTGARILISSDAVPDHLVFLNPDVRLRGPSLTQLADEIEMKPGIGIATGPIVDEEGRRVPSAWGAPSALRAFWFASGWQLPRLRGWLGRWIGRGPATSGASMARSEMPVEGYVIGGAMIVRRECWDDLGGFDERFFLFREDADLCERARQAGWEVWMLHCTPLVHLRGSSTAGVTDEQRRSWYLEGARRYAEKHASPAAARRLELAFRLGSVVSRIRGFGRRRGT